MSKLFPPACINWKMAEQSVNPSCPRPGVLQGIILYWWSWLISWPGENRGDSAFLPGRPGCCLIAYGKNPERWCFQCIWNSETSLSWVVPNYIETPYLPSYGFPRLTATCFKIKLNKNSQACPPPNFATRTFLAPPLRSPPSPAYSKTAVWSLFQILLLPFGQPDLRFRAGGNICLLRVYMRWSSLSPKTGEKPVAQTRTINGPLK